MIKTAHIEPFTQHLNAQHTSIQWTSELEADGKLPLLDTLTTRMSDGSLKLSVYRKPTHTDQYLQFQSHQPEDASHTTRTRTVTGPRVTCLPLHRRRDGTNLPPNQEDGGCRTCQAPHHHLVASKDKDHPQDKCGVVYQLTCQDCEASYIGELAGETERALKQRLKEHLKDSSPVGHHMGYNNHKVDSQNIRIVDRDSRWSQRGVREAIQIRSRPHPQQ